MIYIRTDANIEVATGHIMRCVTIAERLEDIGESVCFLLCEEESKMFVDGKFDYIMLKTDFYDNEAEVREILKIIKGQSKTKKILLDLYKFDASYMKQLGKSVKLITFDDMFSETFPVDLLINYNMYYSLYDYKTRYAGKKTKLLLGGSYVPLRKGFQFEKKNFVMKNTIMMLCGGGDKLHFLLELVKKYIGNTNVNKYNLIVVVGALNQDYEELKKIEEHYSQVKVLKNISNMAEVMCNVDLVVSAAGTVLYESCSLRVPTIFFCIADNQLMDAKFWNTEGLMVYAGDIRKSRNQVVENIFSAIEMLMKNDILREHMIERMKNTVDGMGAERIAKEIAGL